MRRNLLVLVLLVLVPAVSGQSQSPWIEQKGTMYWIASGSSNASHAAHGVVPTGSPQVPFEGCAFAKLEPAIQRARIQMFGVLDEFTAIHIDMKPGTGGKALALNRQTSAEAGGQAAWHPPTFALATMFGEATFQVDQQPFPDPYVSNSTVFRASWAVLRDGIRDDITGAFTTGEGEDDGRNGRASPNDPEMYLRLQSGPGAEAKPWVRTFQQPPLGGLFAMSEEHASVIHFENSRFGGDGVVELTAVTAAPAGQNRLEARLRNPYGDVVATANLTPQAGVDDKQRLEFPLDKFGTYRLEVRGQATLLRYEATVRLTPKGPFDLNLWWDEVLLGDAAQAEWGTCQARLSNPALVAGTAVLQPLPPQLHIQNFVIGGVALVTALLVAGRLVHLSATQAFGPLSHESKK